MLRNIIISILLTTVISIGIGVSIAPVIGFYQGCLLGFIIQVIVNWFYNDYKIRKNNNQQEQILNERLDILSRNFIKFDCPCGKYTFEEVVYMSNENTFDCPQCDQQIKVDITLTPIVVTKIIDIQNTIKQIKELDIPEEI